MYNYTFFDTEIGECAIAWSARGIARLQLPERDRKGTLRSLGSKLRDRILVEKAPPAVVKKAIADVRAHLEGQHNDLLHIEIDYEGVPDFHQKVYEATRRIPPGRTMSYGQVARAAGSPLAARAVGQAMAKNPFPLVVPCHRVVGSNGMGGFSAYGGCVTKEKLLDIERIMEHPVLVPANSEEALEHLGRVDRKMAKLIARVGPYRLQLHEMATPFEALARSIVYQQLTGKAAETIYNRVKSIYGSDALPHPKKILTTPDERLRAAGLSTAKTAAFKDLAKKQIEGVVPTLEEMNRLSDEEIVERLVSIRGVGRWTVEMLLIFKLGRPDVLPIHDYGVRKGFALAYGRGVEDLPTPKELGEYGARWAPYRSVASWYLWRATEQKW
jgi:O-6-methylguanine DNA methyltransferase